MADVICSIECTWDNLGRVKSKIPLGAYEDEQMNIQKIFAPSVPMLIGHQLGALMPMSGLTLTKQFVDYILKEKNSTAPIDTVLQKTRIDVVAVQGIAKMQFHPKTAFLANSQKVDDASRQFLYNYTMHVFKKQPYYNLVSIKIFLGMVLSEYLDLLIKQVSHGKLSPSKLAWNSEISLHMASTSIKMNQAFGLSTAETYNPESEKGVIELFQEVEQKHDRILVRPQT
jgi:hypothetical protein